MTQKEIDGAIKKCRWLSDNSNLIGGICRSKCLPCRRVIEKGECETLIKLLSKRHFKAESEDE